MASVTGAFKTYLSTVVRAGKSALGGEFVAASGAIIRGAKAGVMTRSCPRCYEHSLVRAEGGLYCCVRGDICGWCGGEDDLKQALAWEVNVHPLVYAAAKGRQVEIVKELDRNTMFSWIFWLVAFAVCLYAVYWFAVGRWPFAVWILAVMFWVCLQAIRFSYRAQYLRGLFTQSPWLFLRRPRLWFVT